MSEVRLEVSSPRIELSKRNSPSIAARRFERIRASPEDHPAYPLRSLEDSMAYRSGDRLPRMHCRLVQLTRVTYSIWNRGCSDCDIHSIYRRHGRSKNPLQAFVLWELENLTPSSEIVSPRVSQRIFMSNVRPGVVRSTEPFTGERFL